MLSLLAGAIFNNAKTRRRAKRSMVDKDKRDFDDKGATTRDKSEYESEYEYVRHG